jgi:signal transduction histidine kinase
MKLTNSLRYRLVAGIMGLVLVVCLIFTLGLNFSFEGAEQRLFDDHIKKDVDSFMEMYVRDPGIIDLPRENFRVFVFDKNGKTQLPPYLRGLSPGDNEVKVAGHTYHVITRQKADRTLYFLFDDSSFEKFENFMLASVLVIALTLCLTAALLGLSIAKLIIGPVTSLARRVGGLEEPDAAEPVDKLKTFDEIEVLENAFDSYRKRIAKFLKREQEFSSDASHELRTPLMAIRSAAENISLEQPADPRLQELASRIIRSCDQMSAVTEALLLLARESDIPPEKLEVIDVGDYLKEQIDLLKPILNARKISVEVDENRGLSLRAYRVGLHIVIGNILKNAVLHSQSDVIRISLSDHGLEVEDFGCGIPEDELDALFDRDTGGKIWQDEKTGIGLSLVKRFCDEFDWRLELVSMPSHGTRVRVDFGSAASRPERRMQAI